MSLINRIYLNEKIDLELEGINHNVRNKLLTEIDKIKNILQHNDDINILNSTTPSLIAQKAFEKIISEIEIDIKKNIEQHHKDLDNIGTLYDNLLSHIPPCEIEGTPQSIMKIMTAGWAAYYHYYNETEDIKTRYFQITELNLLCLKALTQSFFFRKFLKAKSGNIN